MKIKKVNHIGIAVNDIDEAVKFFSDLFETPFEKLYNPGQKFRRTVIRENAEPIEKQPQHSVAMSPFPGGLGLELIQDPTSEKQGLRSLAFKVADLEQAKTFAQSAYEKAIGMKYRWQEGDAAHLLGEICLAAGDKVKAQEWIEKAVGCRKEILDPEVKESEKMLKSL